MRIIHFYKDFYRKGGVPWQMQSIAHAQALQGHDVFAISNGNHEVTMNHVKAKDVSYSFTSFFTIRKIIKKIQPDVIHFSAPLITMDAFFCFIVNMMENVTVVISPHGVLNPLGINVRFGGKHQSKLFILLKKLFIKTFLSRLIKSVDILHAESEYEAEVLKKIGAKTIITVPMGVDKNWIKQINNTSFEKIIFTYLGRLDPYHKGLDLIIDATKKLVACKYDFKIIFAGSIVSNSVQWLESRIAEASLENYITISQPAWGKDKEELFNKTTFFLGIFRYAGMARVCGEAIGRGIPLLASREGCWGDWVNKANCGFVPELTIESISGALIKAIQLKKKDYKRMSLNAFEYAQMINWANITANLIEKIKEIKTAR